MGLGARAGWRVRPSRRFRGARCSQEVRPSPAVGAAAANPEAGAGLQGGLSASLVSRIGTYAMKQRLKSYTAVDTDVACSTAGLFGGVIDGVRIEGRDWVSPLGLECTEVGFEIGRVRLDVRALLLLREVRLLERPEGKAKLVVAGVQAGKCLKHKLVTAATETTGIDGTKFTFGDPSGVEVRGGRLHFRVTWDGGDGETYLCELRPSTSADPPGTDRLVVEALHAEHGGTAGAARVSSGLSTFFSEFALVLESARFTCSSIEFLPPDAAAGRPAETMEVNLDVVVDEFKPPSEAPDAVF